MKNKEKELRRFTTEPRYRKKIITKIHKNENKKYKNNIKLLEKEKQKLLKLRKKEIIRINNTRWQIIADGHIRINKTEGKIKINNSEVPFSSVCSAEVDVQNGFRVETKDKSKLKKHTSVGGAIIGGVIAGPIGAVAGGVGLGKTTIKGKSVSNQIPICTYIGVLVNIDGFVTEITILSSQVDQSSFRYSSAYNKAQAIVLELRKISKMPVPKNFIKIEEEKTVRNYDKRIAEIDAKLRCVTNNKPIYRIPYIYRTKEQEFMSDEEYLIYLQGEDERKKQEETVFKEKSKSKVIKEEPQKNIDTVNKTTQIIKMTILWILTGFCLFIAIPSICGALNGFFGILSGVVMMILALLTCPVIAKKTMQIDKLQIYNNYKKIITITLVIIYFILIIIM